MSACNDLFKTIHVYNWKHLKCILFAWKRNILVFTVPILLTWFIVYVSSSSNNARETAIFDPVSEEDLLSYFPSGEDDLLLYSPNTSFNQELIEKLRYKMGITEDRIRGFQSDDELDKYFSTRKGNRDFIIKFKPDQDNIEKPQKLAYSITSKNNNFKTDQVYVNNVYDVAAKDTDEYISSGFLALQKYIDETYIEMITGRTNTIEYEFEKFPTDARQSLFFMGFGLIGPIMTIMYCITLLNMVLVPLIAEKADGVKEFLRIASRFSYINNLSFFFINVTIGCNMFLIMFIIIFVYDGLIHVELIWIGLLMVLYVVSSISYSYLISVLFDSVFYAKLLGFLFYFAPYFLKLVNIEGLRYILPLFNGALILMGFDVIDAVGAKGLVFSAQNVTEKPIADSFSLLEIYALLIANIVLYTLLYYYLSHVFPGACGTPRPFYFPFTRSFYCKNKVDQQYDQIEENLSTEPHGDIAVKVRNLTKVFKKIFSKHKLIAVNGLSLDLHRNQITVLLGHNGAGKTTTMSMITGITPKTSGSISVDGETNIDNYRNKIGYCPQNNVFMNYFTCKDHLWFFGKLRGLNSEEATATAEQLLIDLRLTEKADEYGVRLSGGMKRRLCLGNAIVGNTKIVILDEPSSGLDPESRRELWDILLEMRKDHSILITTHYMEEAEILGDSIAIISNGNLLCHDTSTRLKKKYAIGYVLKLLTNNHFDMHSTLTLIKRYVPNATIKAHVRPTLSINLPYCDQCKFSTVLAELENCQDKLGISSISITNSSLEDVFLNCEKDKHKVAQEYSLDVLDSQIPYENLQNDEQGDVNTPFKSRQFLGIMYKKYIYLKSGWMFLLIALAFPILATYVSFIPINDFMVNQYSMDKPKVNLSSTDNKEIIISVSDSNSLHNFKSLNQSLHHIVTNSNSSVKDISNLTDSIEQELLRLERVNLLHYHENIPSSILMSVVQGTKRPLIKIMFSGNSIHSSGASLNLVSNAVLKSTTNDKYQIETINAPITRNSAVIPTFYFTVFEMLMPMTLFIFMLMYVSLPFQEEHTEFKQLQSMPAYIYWLSTFLFDFVLYLILCVILLGLQYICDRHNVFNDEENGLIITIYIFYGFAYIPLIYLITKLFTSLSSLYSFLSYMYLIAYLAGTILTASADTITKFNLLSYFLLLLPDYALKFGLGVFFITYGQHQSSKYFNSVGSSPSVQYLTESTSYILGSADELSLLRPVIYMFTLSIVLLLFTIIGMENIYYKQMMGKIVDFLLFYKRCCKKKNKHINTYSEVKEDVENEKLLASRILQDGRSNEYPIIVNDLHKNYDDFPAVKGVNFTVQKAECFGLLGVNGAGKTTTFKMMTKDITISRGEVYFKGVDSHKSEYKNYFGYCPQIDALNQFMTAYETLKYIALARGTALSVTIHDEVINWLERTDLMQYKDVQVKEFSGGTKRKLNTAISMITSPSLIFLDEPTTGVDPVSRRFIWSCIKEFQKNNKNIVLTSHSMDECEQLCNRLAIMANGQLMCIGPVQKLKNTFSKGFVICLVLKHKLPLASIMDVKHEMKNKFNCTLKEEYADTLNYLVAETHFKWSTVFQQMQFIYEKYSESIDDFSICETSLEDIFLQFTEKQLSNNNLVEVSAV